MRLYIYMYVLYSDGKLLKLFERIAIELFANYSIAKVIKTFQTCRRRALIYRKVILVSLAYANP